MEKSEQIENDVGQNVPIPIIEPKISPATEKKGGGCLIATAAFSSELASQIQMLREVRDNVLFGTSSGTTFVTGFNDFYYAFSPVAAD